MANSSRDPLAERATVGGILATNDSAQSAALAVFHMVELIDASIRGLTADQILSGKKSLNVPLSVAVESPA